MAELIALEDGWSQIQNKGILRLERFLETGELPQDIFQQEGKPSRIFAANDYANLYTVVYNMCTQRTPHNWADALYRRYSETLNRYLQQFVVPSLQGRHSVSLLEETLHRWQNHKMYAKWLERFFAYLDRYYVKMQSLDALSIKGLVSFKGLVFDAFQPNLTSAILEFITQERETKELPCDTVQGIVAMYYDLGLGINSVYATSLEDPLMPSTANHYAREVAGWLATDTLPEFCVRAEKAFSLEERRVNRYLRQSTWPRLKSNLITTLLANPQQQVLAKETGPQYLLAHDKLDDLRRLYRLFSMVDGGIIPIANTFKQFVTAAGLSILESKMEIYKTMKPNDALADPALVDAFIELHEKYKGIVADCFMNDTVFQRSLKDAFEACLNKDLSPYLSGKSSGSQSTSLTMPGFLASYCDRVLKKSGERLADDAVEAALTKSVDLFTYLTDKDMFAEIYKNQLAKRLLQESSASEDAEKSLIQKLKLKCGAQFCTKLEGMLADTRSASDIQSDFKTRSNVLMTDLVSKYKKMNHANFKPLSHQGEGVKDLSISKNHAHEAIHDIAEKNSLPFDFSVQVLTTGYWPTYLPADCTLPVELVMATDLFLEYYKKKTEHRKLSWIHSLGMVTFAAKFGPLDNPKKYDIGMNTYQAVIMVLLDSNPQLTVQQLQIITGLEEGFLRRLLATLTISRFKLLCRSGDNPKAIESDETLSLNHEFTCPSRRIKIPPPTAPVEEAFSKERVEEDRSITIQAGIVRIMKARKQLSHQQLISELLAQLSFFKPNPKTIKQQIEQLIEREYLERDEEQTNVYNYLA